MASALLHVVAIAWMGVSRVQNDTTSKAAIIKDKWKTIFLLIYKAAELVAHVPCPSVGDQISHFLDAVRSTAKLSAKSKELLRKSTEFLMQAKTVIRQRAATPDSASRKALPKTCSSARFMNRV